MAEAKKNPWGERLKRALGALLFLTSVLFLVSPLGSFWPLGYGMVWLLGFPGFYVLLPLLALLGLSILFFGKTPKIGLFGYLAVAFATLGALSLCGYLSFQSVSNSFEEALNTYMASGKGVPFAISLPYAGGFAFTMLMGALTNLSSVLSVVVIVVMFLVSLLFAVFHPALRKLYRAAYQRHRERKPASKETPAEAPLSAEEPDATVSGFDSYFPSAEEPASPSPLPSEGEEAAEAPLPSRLQASREERFAETGLPQEIDSPLNSQTPSFSDKALSGYMEARFSFPSAPGANPQPARFVKPEPSLPANPVSNDPLLSNSVPLTAATPEPLPSEPTPPPSLETPAREEPEPDPWDLLARETGVSPSAPSESTPIASPDSPETVTVTPSPSVVLEETPQNREIPDETPVESAAPTLTPQPYAAPAPAPEPIPAPVAASEEPISLTPALGKKPTIEEQLDAINCKRKKELKPYSHPPIDLLKEYPPSPEALQEKMNCERRKEVIDECFRDFGIGAHVESFTIGPSVTRYNILTDSNVSVSSLNRIVKDIAVRLEGASIRFEDVVRGRKTSGLEVPNKKTTTVSLKRMVASLPASEGPNLMIPFGVSIDDDCISSDLSEFPHMLVAGTTGSGKSIFMNGMIMSLIMRNRPEDLKLVMVDPKRVEMAKYHDLPHLLCPIIKEPAEAKVCIDKLIAEMERRYKAFEIANVRDIGEWNRDFAPSSPYATLPYIVLFIDEYADLADTCKNISESVVRIAQKARAAGIHMVIATQRPTVQVIPGTIKANIATHVALTMKSAIDSSTILGVGGAENLVGHGDMLVDCTQVSRSGFVRCQGCYCSGSEINAVCDYIRGQLPPDYDPYFLDLVDHEAERKAQEAMSDPLPQIDAKAASGADFYQQVKEWVMTQEATSISKIMRHFGTGFPRAGKLLAQLQRDGIVAESDTASNAKGCRVLIHSEGTMSSGETTLQGDNE